MRSDGGLRPRRLARLDDALAGQRVGTLVLGMAGMALDPDPFDLMALQGLFERQPQIDVLHRLLVGRFPAVALPAVDEARDAVLQILARSEEHTSELQSQSNLVCRLLLEKK